MLRDKVPNVLCSVLGLPRLWNIEYFKKVMEDAFFNVLVLESSFFVIRQEGQPILYKKFGAPSDYFYYTYLSNVIQIRLSSWH